MHPPKEQHEIWLIPESSMAHLGTNMDMVLNKIGTKGKWTRPKMGGGLSITLKKKNIKKKNAQPRA